MFDSEGRLMWFVPLKLTCSSLTLVAAVEVCCAKIMKCSPDFLSSGSGLDSE